MSMSSDSPPKLAGKKRKHYMIIEEDTSVKLTGKLHHYCKEMRKAAKKSKTFETQRLIKRLKDLRKPIQTSGKVHESTEELESQLASLKRTDHERIANLALSSKIRKDGELASNAALMASLASVMNTTANANANVDAMHTKVERRLLSSKILAAQTQEAVKGLRAVLNPGTAAKARGDVRAMNINGDPKQGTVGGIDKGPGVDVRPRSEVSDSDGSDGGEVEGTAIFEEVVDEPDDMIDDGGWESGSIDGVEHVKSDESDDDEGGNVEGEGSISLHQKPKQLSSSSLEPLNQKTSVPSSTFLPSLSVGYIKGDGSSDVDPSDGETAASRRKNRRGQRARQAIWEKKYGRNAMHLKKQYEDARSAATARTLGKRPDKGWPREGHRQGEPSAHAPIGRTKNRLAQRHSQGQLESVLPHADRPMHPSWEAKRKLKEKESARILPSQGKKIVFN